MRLALENLDDRARLGIRGLNLTRWLNANGYSVGDSPNVAYTQFDGSLLGRLSPSELVWLGTASQSIDGLTRIIENYSCYTLSRRDSHAWFRLTGPDAPRMLAKICGVDLSTDAFGNHRVAQTSAARVSTVIIRDDEGLPSYHLLAESSCARYLEAVLIDAGQEFSRNTTERKSSRQSGAVIP